MLLPGEALLVAGDFCQDIEPLVDPSIVHVDPGQVVEVYGTYGAVAFQPVEPVEIAEPGLLIPGESVQFSQFGKSQQQVVNPGRLQALVLTDKDGLHHGMGGDVLLVKGGRLTALPLLGGQAGGSQFRRDGIGEHGRCR